MHRGPWLPTAFLMFLVVAAVGTGAYLLVDDAHDDLALRSAVHHVQDGGDDARVVGVQTQVFRVSDAGRGTHLGTGWATSVPGFTGDGTFDLDLGQGGLHPGRATVLVDPDGHLVAVEQGQRLVFVAGAGLGGFLRSVVGALGLLLVGAAVLWWLARMAALHVTPEVPHALIVSAAIAVVAWVFMVWGVIWFVALPVVVLGAGGISSVMALRTQRRRGGGGRYTIVRY